MRQNDYEILLQNLCKEAKRSNGLYISRFKTLALVNELYYITLDLIANQNSWTINKELAEFFKEFGAHVVPKGIGFEIGG